MRLGCVLVALAHPTLGVVRLAPAEEDYVVGRAERAAGLRAEADRLENESADEAERILERFVAGEA